MYFETERIILNKNHTKVRKSQSDQKKAIIIGLSNTIISFEIVPRQTKRYIYQNYKID